MSVMLSLLMLSVVTAFSPAAPICRRPALPVALRPAPTMITEDDLRMKIASLQAGSPEQIQMEIDVLERQLEVAKLRQQLALSAGAVAQPKKAAAAKTKKASPEKAPAAKGVTHVPSNMEVWELDGCGPPGFGATYQPKGMSTGRAAEAPGKWTKAKHPYQ